LSVPECATIAGGRRVSLAGFEHETSTFNLADKTVFLGSTCEVEKNLMRCLILLIFASALTLGLLACNSNETLLSQKPANQAATPTSQPADNARRITADELHKLWEKNDVVIIDTRPEPAYKGEHIKGAISMPTGMVLSHLDELPRNKLIAAYCT